MKQYLYRISAIAVFFLMLFFPGAAFEGASDGLMLWFNTVLPTLFPFMLASEIMLSGGGIRMLTKVVSRPVKKLFCVSENGSFAVLAGFLCGYPMGAKITADLIRKDMICVDEGKYLLSFCNNTSPAFMINFVMWNVLNREDLIIPGMVIVFLTPVILSFPFRKLYDIRKNLSYSGSFSRSREDTFNFKIFDSCMMDSMEAVTKVGGYIIVFSVLISVLKNFSCNIKIMNGIIPLLEMTNGIVFLKDIISENSLSFSLIMGLCAFGGLCSAAQTDCMIQGTGLSVFPYIMQKLAAGTAASLMAYLYCIVTGF